MLNDKEQQRIYRHQRIRDNLSGTQERPRLCLHRSLNNLQAQIIDDAAGKILVGKSTLAKEVKTKIKSGGNVSAASILGEVLAAEAVKKGIKKVAFDRGGYLYHGRVKAFAEAARRGGLEF
ncbi:MAG: 50S ribosomal protein L18 [Candidatus Omnitrophica bacterium]|nr:50S ribosomal protein L18 [Candidatus Omnitrophota bacterium]